MAYLITKTSPLKKFLQVAEYMKESTLKSIENISQPRTRMAMEFQTAKTMMTMVMEFLTTWTMMMIMMAFLMIKKTMMAMESPTMKTMMMTMTESLMTKRMSFPSTLTGSTKSGGQGGLEEEDGLSTTSTSLSLAG